MILPALMNAIEWDIFTECAEFVADMVSSRVRWKIENEIWDRAGFIPSGMSQFLCNVGLEESFEWQSEE